MFTFFAINVLFVASVAYATISYDHEKTSISNFSDGFPAMTDEFPWRQPV